MPSITRTATSVREDFIEHVENNAPICTAYIDEVLGALVDFADPDNIKTDVMFSKQEWVRAGCEIPIDAGGKYLALKGYRVIAGLSGGLMVSYDI